MQLKALTLVALASSASAQSLTQVLANQSSLSNLTSFLGLLPSLVGELGTLSNITLLAPNNDAFASFLNNSGASSAISSNDTSLITALLSYHVINGTYSNFTSMPEFLPSLLQSPDYANVTGGQVVDAFGMSIYSGLLQESNITGTPLNFTGGVIHIIDKLLTLPENISTTAVELNLTSAAGALTSAHLVDTVDELMDVTVFVPSNEAFQEIGSALANLSMAQLTSILEYHVVQGIVGYSSLLGNVSLKTVQGSNITITVEASGEVFVNSAMVIIPNVLVANGVVHVIDNVLNPSNTTATPNPSASTQAPAFPSASSATNVPFTSGVPTPTGSVSTSGAGAASTSTGAAALPMKTGALAAAALFGGAAVMMNL